MNFDRDPTNTDEYFLTAVDIFDCCGVESSGSLRVDALMDKFAPFVKNNKAEFSFLKTLLDPEQCNPDINVTKLAKALHKCSESQKTNLDESFNLKSGQVPQDSDSGISSDGEFIIIESDTEAGKRVCTVKLQETNGRKALHICLQLLDELQCELKEKEHLAQQLRAQLDYSDRQHEEALAGLQAERDSLRSHLNMVREENATLSHVRRDYDDVCERLCVSETALADVTKELDALRKRAKIYQEHAAQLENDKVTLQELLSKSKDECHRINEMYAARQSALLEDNETMKAEHADLSSRFQDQEEFMQQIIKEKVHLEMELKDVLNKSNQTHLRLDRSIDISYTDDQMLTALDSLNADSRFTSEMRTLEEESFLSVFKGDQGRPTNMSLFDEIRLSSTYFSNKSRLSFADPTTDTYDLECSISSKSIGTQTDEDANEIRPYDDSYRTDSIIDRFVRNKHENLDVIDKSIVNVETQTDNKASVETEKHNVEVQTENDMVTKGIQTIGMLVKNRPYMKQHRVPFPKAMLLKKSADTQTENWECNTSKLEVETVETQTEVDEIFSENNNTQNSKCLECETARKHKDKLEIDLQYSNSVVAEVQVEITKYEENLADLQKLIVEGKDKNRVLHSVIQNLTTKIEILQAVSEKQGDMIERVLEPEVCCIDCQTEFDQVSVSTQVEVACVDCEKRSDVVPHRGLRRFFWEPLKCLFQVFAVICFISAVCVLCGVAARSAHAHCRAAPWRWLQLHDVMDLLFRIEYTADVPM